MDQKDAGSLESRPPQLQDLLKLCESLNEHGVKYIVIGGMAMIQHGYVRATEDIDVLVEAGRENEEKLKDALMYLPDQAVKEMAVGEIERYSVVRVADEIVIDLMKSAGGVEYRQAAQSVEMVEIRGVKIPFASVELLWRMKQTRREKDALDIIFLKERMNKKQG